MKSRTDSIPNLRKPVAACTAVQQTLDSIRRRHKSAKHAIQNLHRLHNRRLSSDMKVFLSTSVCLVCCWGGATFKPVFFKKPVAGPSVCGQPISMGPPSRPSVHGGPEQSVYCYPCEHYAAWNAELPELSDVARTWGAFGENSHGELLERQFPSETASTSAPLCQGNDATASCFKLAAKFQRDDMIERFVRSGRSGFYFSVIEEGEVGAGDKLDSSDVRSLPSPLPINGLYTAKSPIVRRCNARWMSSSYPKAGACGSSTSGRHGRSKT